MTFQSGTGGANVTALHPPKGDGATEKAPKADKETKKSAGKNGAKAPRVPRTGRTDRSGQEAIINQTLLMQKLPGLVKLIKAAEETKNDLSEAVKKVAEDTGYYAKVVLRRAKAEASDDYADKQKEVRQLGLAFETDTPFLKG